MTISVFSNYVETGNISNVDQIPSYSFFSQTDQEFRWRDLYFYGFIDTFEITENWTEEARMYTGIINVSAANIQMILQNRNAGRYTNDASWEYYNAGDTSMNRVAIITNIYYPFGL